MDEMYRRVTELLSERNEKIADLCRGTGLTSTIFSEWKSGKAVPKLDKLRLVADYLDVSLDYLTGQTGRTLPPLPSTDHTHWVPVLGRVAAGIRPEDIRDGLLVINRVVAIAKGASAPSGVVSVILYSGVVSVILYSGVVSVILYSGVVSVILYKVIAVLLSSGGLFGPVIFHEGFVIHVLVFFEAVAPPFDVGR